MMEHSERRLKVYLESSISSYYAALPSPDPIKAAWQAYTIRWVNDWAGKCDLFVSKYVLAENMRGNPVRAQERMTFNQRAALIEVDDFLVKRLADTFIRPGAIPENERVDAYHVATATIYGMDVLLTWNCTHINNPVILPQVYSQIAVSGYPCPKILTPKQFLEAYHD